MLRNEATERSENDWSSDTGKHHYHWPRLNIPDTIHRLTNVHHIVYFLERCTLFFANILLFKEVQVFQRNFIMEAACAFFSILEASITSVAALEANSIFVKCSRWANGCTDSLILE